MPKLPDQQSKLLAAYAASGRLCSALRSVGLKYTDHVGWMRKSSLYRAAFAEAQSEIAQRLEDEAYRRAMPHITKAEGDGVAAYSDNLLMFLLRAYHPKRFGEQMLLEYPITQGTDQ